MKRFFLSLVLAGVSLPAAAQDPPPHLVFSAIEDSVDTLTSAAILKEAYGRLGITIRIQYVSGPEALRRSNAGEVDGEVCRIEGVSKEFPNLIQVGVPINYIQAAVFSRDPDLKLVGWHSLRPYRIGRVQGVLFAEQGTRGMDTVVAEDYGGLMELLVRGEVDVVVAPYLNGRRAILAHPRGGELQLNGILETQLLYHYLHKKHADLVPAIDRVLKPLVKDGTITARRREIVDKLLEEAAK